MHSDRASTSTSNDRFAQGAQAAGRIGRKVGRAIGWSLGQLSAASRRAGAATWRWARRHRAPLIAVAERVAWWGALALTAIAARDLLGGFADDVAYARIPMLALASFGLCAWVCFSTAASHLRKGAFVLGGSAAAVGIVSWMSASA